MQDYSASGEIKLKNQSEIHPIGYPHSYEIQNWTIVL